MNKAFVREPDEPDVLRCPACDVAGQPVAADTLAAHLPQAEARRLADGACFCPNPRCPVGYFDKTATVVSATLVSPSVYPKRPDAAVCSCLNITADDILGDAGRNDPTRVRRILAHAASPQARCATVAANGQSCIGLAQPLYLKHLQRQTPAR